MKEYIARLEKFEGLKQYVKPIPLDSKYYPAQEFMKIYEVRRKREKRFNINSCEEEFLPPTSEQMKLFEGLLERKEKLLRVGNSRTAFEMDQMSFWGEQYNFCEI